MPSNICPACGHPMAVHVDMDGGIGTKQAIFCPSDILPRKPKHTMAMACPMTEGVSGIELGEAVTSFAIDNERGAE